MRLLQTHTCTSFYSSASASLFFKQLWNSPIYLIHHFSISSEHPGSSCRGRESSINYSRLLFWPQGQRCQNRPAPQQWCIAAINLSTKQPRPTSCSLISTTLTVTSARSHTGSDSYSAASRSGRASGPSMAKDITGGREAGVTTCCFWLNEALAPPQRWAVHAQVPFGRNSNLTWITSVLLCSACAVTLVAPSRLATPCQTLWRHSSASILAFSTANGLKGSQTKCSKEEQFISCSAWNSWMYSLEFVTLVSGAALSSSAFSAGIISPQAKRTETKSIISPLNSGNIGNRQVDFIKRGFNFLQTLQPRVLLG